MVLVLLSALAPLFAASAAVPVSVSLDTGWQFRLAPGDKHAAGHPAATQWHPATVPGSVQTDLMAQKLVPDPYWRLNEAKIQWVGLASWEYHKSFTVDAATLARHHVDLVFDGLDTLADVYLDGHKILSADDMFRRWRVRVKDALHVGTNTLEVRFRSPVSSVLPWLEKQPYHLPGEFQSVFGDLPPHMHPMAYVRKAAYQFGWDWGPRIVTEGIWHPVQLQSWNDYRLANLYIAQPLVTAAVAKLAATLTVHADRAGTARVRLAWTAPDGSRHTLDKAATLTTGVNHIALPFAISHPQRWWPVGYGKPNLYRFRATLSVAGRVVGEATQVTGLRSVVLQRKQDKWGKSFAFIVNGVPIFAKGANFIPMDEFPNRVTPARIDQLLESAKDANMNMLRIWGGGYYLPAHFYAEADKLGLMLWQGFMFGGTVPPPTAAYSDNARIEAIQQIRRLRSHPSIVLWCGNNEIDDGWETFPRYHRFEASVTAAQRKQIYDSMHALFYDTLRKVVADNEPSVPYWPTSPGTDGEGPVNNVRNGDYHYWNVWSGKALPATAYLDITPRFMSEYGLQAMPVMATIDSFTAPADRVLGSPVLRAHEKYLRGKHYDESTGGQRLMQYVERDYGRPKDLAAMVYLSQVMQAHGIQLAAEHLRASRPQSMGSLYWQLDDVWPGTTWASVDYYGRWKSLQYHARRFYAPLLIAALRNHSTTRVTLVSDRTEPVAARWRVRVMNFTGKVLEQRQASVTLAPLSATHVAQFTDAELLHGASPVDTFAVFDLVVDGKRVSRNLVFFAAPKQLALPRPSLQARLEPGARTGTYTLTLHSAQLARDVWVSFGSLDADVSDNSFNVLPGGTVTLGVKSNAGLAVLRRALTTQNLAGVMVSGGG